jgi:N-acetylmuramoyl-L-alanine amidase
MVSPSYRNSLSVRNALWVLILLSLGFLPVALVAQSISTIRCAPNEGADRVVVETQGAPNATFASAGTMGTVSVDFHGVATAPTLPSFPQNMSILSGWKGSYFPDQKIYRLELKHTDDLSWSSFTLREPHRLVIDFKPGNSVKPLPTKPSSESFAGSLELGSPVENQVQPVAQITPPIRTSGFRPRIIIVDPGHGGRHRGGVGRVNGKQITEAEVVMPIALHLNELLKKDPRFNPQLTRTKDVYLGLRERTKIAEEKNGNLFVSIHYNAVPTTKAPTSARGLEFWTWSPNVNLKDAEKYLFALDNEEDSSTDVGNPNAAARGVLSKMVSDALLEQSVESRHAAKALEGPFLQDSFFKRHYRGIKESRFKVLENYSMPSVLVEVAFISHPEEAKLSLQRDFQLKVARYLYNGIVAYFEARDPEFKAQARPR